jgi:hypothetical protein
MAKKRRHTPDPSIPPSTAGPGTGRVGPETFVRGAELRSV